MEAFANDQIEKASSAYNGHGPHGHVENPRRDTLRPVVAAEVLADNVGVVVGCDLLVAVQIPSDSVSTWPNLAQICPKHEYAQMRPECSPNSQNASQKNLTM